MRYKFRPLGENQQVVHDVNEERQSVQRISAPEPVARIELHFEVPPSQRRNKQTEIARKKLQLLPQYFYPAEAQHVLPNLEAQCGQQTAKKQVRQPPAAAGTAPLTFLWSRDGVALADAAGIEGSRAATLRLTNVQAAQAGSYTVRVSNSAGAVTSGAAVLTVNQPPPVPPPATGLAAAVDTTLAVTGSGNTPWTAQTTVTHDGNDAARSGPITNNQRSTLQVTGVQGPATVSFWWKVDSEATFDFLTVELDGIQPFTGISGDIDWQQRTINIPAGTHTLQWHYSKDESVSERQDAAWIDQLTIT